MEAHIANIKSMVKEYDTKDVNDMKRLMSKIRHYFKSNPEANSIDTKVLNSELCIDGYVFCKRGKQQQLIKKYYVPRTEVSDSDSNISCKPQSQTTQMNHRPLQIINEIDPEIKMKADDVFDKYRALENEIVEIKQSIKSMSKEIMQMLDTIQGLQKAGYGCSNGYAMYLNKSFSGN